MGRLSLGDNGLWKVHEYIRLGSSRNTKPPCEGERLAGNLTNDTEPVIMIIR